MKTNFQERDTVSFDLFCATGTGWVENPQENKCCISVSTFEWKSGYEEQQDEIEDKYGISEYYCEGISYDSLEIIDEENWTDDFRSEYIERTLALNSKLELLPNIEKQKLIKNIDILCEHDVWLGLMRKGYFCYGDSPLYKCDWNESRKCLERCMELNSDPAIANTLGYIYYYGRCSNGKPDYDKAYKYFSMGALAGNHESIYKVGDMFLKGLGIPKNVEIAHELYEKVYDITKKELLNGNRFNNFADAALRMTGVYEQQGYGKEAIYGKYLEADFGLKLRSSINYYGDSVVRKSVDAGLEKFKPEKKCTAFHNEKASFADAMTENALNDNLLKVSIERKGQEVKGTLEIVNSETKKKSKYSYVLLTLPEVSFCGFVRSYSFSCTLLEEGFCGFEEGKTTVFCKSMEDDYCETLFITENNEYLSLESDDWIMRSPTKKDVFDPFVKNDIEINNDIEETLI